ncbi:manganese catalase family protein [Bacillus sp. J33]|uniref:manganese catalase family protein n=1 Tax=Bacillus sp. J33 TaxID=935836 RepID=UPI001E4498D0|nr:manganese catalase family protein [Bacillus sp. J33]
MGCKIEREYANVLSRNWDHRKVSTFPRELEKRRVFLCIYESSRGEEQWASEQSMDGQGTFQYLQEVPPFAPAPKLQPAPDTPPNVK